MHTNKVGARRVAVGSPEADCSWLNPGCFIWSLVRPHPSRVRQSDLSSVFCVLLQMQEFWSTGVLTAKTRCWAQGMDGWRPLQAIPQLKWCLLATGQAVMNETDLATLILNMLISMCSYYPSR